MIDQSSVLTETQLRAAEKQGQHDIVREYALRTLKIREQQLDPEQMAESLFQHIKHGDEQHQAWLKEQSVVWAKQWVNQHFLLGVNILAGVLST